MSNYKNFNKIVVALIGLSIVAKLVFMIASGAHIQPKMWEYEQVAQNLLKGNGFYYNNFSTNIYAGIAPVYPIFCFVVYKIFGHHPVIVILIQILISSLLVLVVSRIALNIFDELTAIIASFFVALHPPLIYYTSTNLHSISIYSFFFALLILSFLWLRQSLTIRNILLVGLIAGFTASLRVTVLGFVFLGLIWLYFYSDDIPKKKLSAIVSIIFIFCVIMLPWSVRNYHVFKKPVLLQTNKWESLWYGNMPGSNGSLYTKDGIPVFQRAKNNLPLNFYDMDEIERGEYFKEETIKFFKNDPAAFIKRIFKKVFYFWYFSPHQGSQYPESWKIAYKILYICMLIPAILAITHCLFKRSKKTNTAGLILIGLFLVAITCSHSLYFVEGRHRASVEAFLLIFSANGIVLLKEIFVNKLNKT